MNKDIIYIDVEDDVTAIIGKIKASSERIVALVPPKRTGVLQSAVNLRLLSRIADKSDKRLVIITNNKALIALSASAKIPVAKNLQSKPEIAEIDALEVDDGEDVIDGSQLPIGELAKTASSDPDNEVSDVIDTIDIENEGFKTPKTIPKTNIKVPDFSRFRKKLFIGAGIGIVLIAFLVWAIQFAPAATIIITTRTSSADISKTLTLGSGTTSTDASKGIVQTVTKQVKKDVSVDFTATGTQTLGTKATGTVVLSNADSSDAIAVPSGSIFNDGDYNFATTSTVNVPGATVVNKSIVPGSITVNVIATAVGAGYNLSPDDYQSSVDGVTAYGNQMSGGASHEATIVTADDIQKASQNLVDLSSDSVKQQLVKQFTNGEFVISDSFTVNHAAAVSVPAVSAEATGGKAKLTSSTTFSITAIAKSELEAYLKYAIKQQMDSSKNQRLYDDGIDNAKLSGYLLNDQGVATANVNATGRIGLNISDTSIKQQVKGKQFGDAQSIITNIDGVDDVNIKFSYFWVTTIPNDVNKIDVQFVIKNA
jgi:hypothetical protein